MQGLARGLQGRVVWRNVQRLGQVVPGRAGLATGLQQPGVERAAGRPVAAVRARSVGAKSQCAPVVAGLHECAHLGCLGVGRMQHAGGALEAGLGRCGIALGQGPLAVVQQCLALLQQAAAAGWIGSGLQALARLQAPLRHLSGHRAGHQQRGHRAGHRQRGHPAGHPARGQQGGGQAPGSRHGDQGSATVLTRGLDSTAAAGL